MEKIKIVGLDQNNNKISPIVCEEIINLPCVDATETYVNNEIDTNLIPEKEREQLKALMENKKPQIENEIKENCKRHNYLVYTIVKSEKRQNYHQLGQYDYGYK